LSVYDVLGRRVAALAEGFREAGRHTISWTGTDDVGNLIPAGVYVLRLEYEGGIQTKKVVRAVQ
jgi:flagellar hook assembly protein FlgD